MQPQLPGESLPVELSPPSPPPQFAAPIPCPKREAKKQEDLRVSHDAAISAQCNFFNPKHIGSNGKAAVNAEIDAQGINFNNAPYEDSQHDGEAGNTDGIEEDIADGEAGNADSIEEDVARPVFSTANLHPMPHV